MRKGKGKIAAALVLSVSMMMGTALAAGTSFSDVPKSHWAYTYVNRACEEGLVSGIGEGKYGAESKLSAAHFAVMVCGLFYPSTVKEYEGGSNDWWYPYMEAAYQKGVLAGTTAGERRAADKKWSESVANASLNRYDLAQIISNTADKQGWEEPSAAELAIAVAKIPDWISMPSKYRDAVTVCYAKGYLNGMDDKGTFSGESSMTRAQAAVVLCGLMDEKEKANSPVYTNKDRLVNGKEANEDNVSAALTGLKAEYPNNGVWDLDREYTSAELGSAIESEGFIYMLSDKVFGAMPAEEVDDPEDLKVGDLLYLRAEGQHVLVTDVERNDFTYVYCDDRGVISWRGEGYIDDLGSRDTIYTRYEGEPREAELANGDPVTERNVTGALSDLWDEYEDDPYWDMDKKYRSGVFPSATGGEAFTYFISDEIFGDLDVTDHNKVSDLRVGDVVERYDEEDYVVILEIDRDEYRYLCVDKNGKMLWDNWEYLDELDRWDNIYTRYPGDVEDDEDTLTNGKTATEKNVLGLLDDLEYDYDGAEWLSDRHHRSDVLGTGYGSEAFAYFISDEIFGELEVSEHKNHDEMLAGDILYLSEYDEYVVVLGVDRDVVTYAYADEDREKVYWDREYDLDDLVRDDTVFTRYPEAVKDEKDDTLANGKAATEKNVLSLLSDLEDDYDGTEWLSDRRYRSDVLGTGYGSEAFAYLISDKIFGELEVSEHTDHEEMLAGDILFVSSYGEYVVVLDVTGDIVTYADADESREKVYWDRELVLSDLGKSDTVFTRYP